MKTSMRKTSTTTTTTKMNKEEFYTAVSSMLGVDDSYQEPKQYRRRWGQRTAGNGRFEGHGIVRWFGENLIHVALTAPELHGTFTSPEECFQSIDAALRDK